MKLDRLVERRTASVLRMEHVLGNQVVRQQVFPMKAAVERLDHSLLSKMEISGCNLKNIVLISAFLAAKEGGAIRMEQVFQAARREYAEIDKLVSESEFGAYYTAMKCK